MCDSHLDIGWKRWIYANVLDSDTLTGDCHFLHLIVSHDNLQGVFIFRMCQNCRDLGKFEKKFFAEKVYFCRNTRVISCKSFEEWGVKNCGKMTNVDIFFGDI